MSTRAGFVGVGIWLALLAAALISHPQFDNLAVGYPVWVFGGLPALESLGEYPLLFVLVALLETVVVFAVFAGIGAALGKLWRPRQP